MNLAERTKIALERSGKKKTDIEQEAQLPKGYMTRIIKGERRSLGPEMMGRLAHALGVTHEWLASGEGKVQGPIVVDEDADGFAEIVERSSPIDAVLERYPWPPELEPDAMAKVEVQVRQEHFKFGAQIATQAYWHTRIERLVDEALGVAKSAPQREREAVDLTEESPEVRGARKRPKKL